MRGPTSTYCGSLWLTALEAGIAIASYLEDHEWADIFRQWLSDGLEKWESMLWNGAYFNFDASGRTNVSDTLMADALAGMWYADATSLPAISESSRIRSALLSVYHFNVRLFGRGKLVGAVNGMRPNGKMDKSTLQSEEVRYMPTVQYHAIDIQVHLHYQY